MCSRPCAFAVSGLGRPLGAAHTRDSSRTTPYPLLAHEQAGRVVRTAGPFLHKISPHHDPAPLPPQQPSPGRRAGARPEQLVLKNSSSHGARRSPSSSRSTRFWPRRPRAPPGLRRAPAPLRRPPLPSALDGNISVRLPPGALALALRRPSMDCAVLLAFASLFLTIRSISMVYIHHLVGYYAVHVFADLLP